MAGISSMGVGSGIDIQSLVQQLVAAERAPWLNRLNRSEAKLQGELSALGTVRGALSGFQSALASLKDPANFSKRSATSGDTDQFAVSASSSAVAASYQVQVNQLAQAHKLASTGFASSTDVVGTGTLTFQFGDPTKPTQTVEIDESNNTLEGIRDAVNEAKIGVTATIVNGNDGYQLVFSSDEMGLDNSLRISITETKKNATTGVYEAFDDGLISQGLSQLMEATLESGSVADATTPIGGGTMTFKFDDGSTSDVVIAAGSTLENIRDAVNTASVGVTASIIDDGAGGSQLVFESNQANGGSLTTVAVLDDDGVNTDAAGLSYFAGVSGTFAEKQAAQDAKLTIDGITVTRATNNISDAIDGITLDLKAVGTSAGTLSVALDKGSVSKAVDSFVSAFNSLAGTMHSLTKYDAETKQAGVLIGDATLRGINSELRRIIGNAVGGLSGAYQSLGDIGIKTNRDGTLSLDSSRLQEALSSNFDDISKLFSAGLTPTNPLMSYVSSSDATAVGDYKVKITKPAAQASYLGATAPTFPLTVDTTNDNFTIKVDGVQSRSLSLTQKIYATADDLAAEMQSRINGDSNLQDAGVTVTVSVEAGKIKVTSDRYGSESKVELVVENMNIGLGGGVGTEGADVAGTIGGLTATGSGQYLTGTGAAAGLKIKYVGTALDDTGTVTFSRGVADQLGTVLERLLDTEGSIKSRTDSLNDRIKDLGKQRDALDLRIASIEQRFIKQFTAMDTLIAQMNSTGQFLSQQLAGLPGMVV